MNYLSTQINSTVPCLVLARAHALKLPFLHITFITKLET